MKKLFFLFVVACSISINAQEIHYENGKFGMINSSGKALLSYDYDHISNVIQFGRKSPYYKLRQGNKYGLYSTLDFKSTGCIYDSVYIDLNLIYFRNDTLYGFLAQTDNSYAVIDPHYEEVYPMNEMHNYGHRPILSLHNYTISVKKNGLWGLVRLSDGKETLPVKFRYEVSWLDDNFYVMQDTGKTELLINQTTHAEFNSTLNGHKILNQEKTYLLLYDRHSAGTSSYRVAVYNYDSGHLLWEYTSFADRVIVSFVSEQIVQVHEEFYLLNGIVNDETNTYTFYNITNGAPLLRHEGRDHCIIYLESTESKIIVYSTEHYNSRKKQIGEIYK